MRRLLPLLLALLACTAPVRAAERVLVLVHGAWGTGAYWDPVASRLRAAGAVVEAVDLPLGAASITLADQAAAIRAAIDRHPGPGVTLVAHSAGTRPAIAAWDAARDRVAAVVFVEGMPPVPGADAVAVPEDERSLAWLSANAPGILETGLLPPPATLDPAHRDAATAHPIATLYGAVPLAHGPLPAVPSLYVLAEDSGISDFKQIAAILQTVPGWTIRTIPGGHDVARDAPAALAKLLLAWP